VFRKLVSPFVQVLDRRLDQVHEHMSAEGHSTRVTTSEVLGVVGDQSAALRLAADRLGPATAALTEASVFLEHVALRLEDAATAALGQTVQGSRGVAVAVGSLLEAVAIRPGEGLVLVVVAPAPPEVQARAADDAAAGAEVVEQWWAQELDGHWVPCAPEDLDGGPGVVVARTRAR